MAQRRRHERVQRVPRFDRKLFVERHACKHQTGASTLLPIAWLPLAVD